MDSVWWRGSSSSAAAHAQVQPVTIEQALVVPIYVQAELTVTASSVQGISFDASGFPVFYDAWIQQ